MVFIVLAAFVLGCAFGVLAMVPSWWRHRRVARRHRPEPATAATPPRRRARRARRTLSPSRRRAMDFDLQWLLLGLPLAFALGWLASRIDVRQWKREQRESPQAYFKGLNLLLNEQQDKAIDAFIEAVQQRPRTAPTCTSRSATCFVAAASTSARCACTNTCSSVPTCRRPQRERAQDALAQDFMKAGLFDRAEAGLPRARGHAASTPTPSSPCSSLYERSRDWHAAIEVARKLERSGTASFASRIAHYWCEIAEEADARQQARSGGGRAAAGPPRAPQAPRPLVLHGRRLARQGEHAQAMLAFGGTAGRASRFVQPGRSRLRGQRARLWAARMPLASKWTPCTDKTRRSTCCLRSALLDPDAGATSAPASRHTCARSRRLRQPGSCWRSVPKSRPPLSGSEAMAIGDDRRRAPHDRCSATDARPAVSRRSTTSGNVRAAWPGTATRRNGWRTRC